MHSSPCERNGIELGYLPVIDRSDQEASVRQQRTRSVANCAPGISGAKDQRRGKRTPHVVNRIIDLTRICPVFLNTAGEIRIFTTDDYETAVGQHGRCVESSPKS